MIINLPVDLQDTNMFASDFQVSHNQQLNTEPVVH